MKTETTKVTKLHLTELEALDPITVYLEDFAPGKGKITIECFGKSWSDGWPGMGDRTVSQFFVEADEHYLAKNLGNPADHREIDYDGLVQTARESVCRMRREQDLSVEDARDLYDALGDVASCSNEVELEAHSQTLREALGNEWFFDIPEKPSSERIYLGRIIQAVQAGLIESGLATGRPAA